MGDTRQKQLGFRPQKEIIYNKLLPYADKLDKESSALYHDIKTNLVKAFLAREIRPGCALWTSRLHKYMKIYGLKFSKEDHIGFIKLFYELVTLPNLEPTRVNKFAGALNFLLKKKELLSRDDLQLEWRPLYDLYERITKKNRLSIGTYRYFPTLEHTLDILIRSSRTYFPVTATQEILDELRPQFCPHSSKDMVYLMHHFEIFLPVVMKPSEADLGYKLWFEEFMNIWDVCHNVCRGENQIASLMASLAQNNIGYIDWEPYVPLIFVHFMRSFQFPVCYRQKQPNKVFKIDVNSMTIWIVSGLGGPSKTVEKHLGLFMQSIESYFNVANIGRWSCKIHDFLKKIALNFVNRIHKERYKEPTWQNSIPSEYQLSDEDIDNFVNMMKPALEHCIFSRQLHDVVYTLNYLACLRPRIIIPMVLDKLYASVDSLTEPHKLTSAMLAVTSVSRYMVQGKNIGFPEGPTHVIPLLMSLLPGIDPNDRRKCYMTFNFIVQFVNMIPLINSSEAFKYYDDLTEEEHVVCEATAGLEDFVLQFFDRLCIWIESNSLETTRMEQSDYDRKKTKSEHTAESALVSVISSVLKQLSPNIFTCALKKIYNFATSRIFEIEVSGKLVGILCQMFSRINPKETAKMFIPYLCNTLRSFLDDSDVMGEEVLNGEILYNLLLLSEVVDCNSEILPYLDDVIAILDKVLYMTSQQANQLGTQMLNMLMTTLTFTKPTEYRGDIFPYDTHIKDYLSIRSWGKAGDINNLNINWYMPTKREIDSVQMLLNHYLVPELNKLASYADGTLMLSRQELRRTFRIIYACLGCHIVMPVWKEPAENLIDSLLDPWAFELIVGSEYEVTMPDGSNVRKAIADVLHKVQKKVVEQDEGDIKSITFIICIYDVLLFNRFKGRDFENHWKNFHFLKGMLEDKLHKKKKHLRHVLIDRVMLHQEFRNESRSCSFTATHNQIMIDLFDLATSRYSSIRASAQSRLNTAITTFPYSFTILSNLITNTLKLNSVENHEKFKGCLYILLGPKGTPLIARHDWNFIKQIWPLLIQSQPSEKPSIVNLMDSLVDTVHKLFPTIAIEIEVPDRTLKVGYDLAKNIPIVDTEKFKHTIEVGPLALKERGAKNLKDYNELVNFLLSTATSDKLHWRYYMMSVCFLRDLVHPDIKYNDNVVDFFLKSLINDSLRIRKLAVKVMLYILMQNKRKFPKVVIDPKSVKVPGAKPCKSLERDINNDWLYYDSSTVPTTAAEWDAHRYLHDESTGFYCWPKEVKVYDYSARTTLNESSMEPAQLIIYKFFCDKSNVDTLIRFYSIEEKKGNDKFNSYRFLLFKYLFKMFEDKMMAIFLPHLSRLVKDKQEQSQRCASEIIAGSISGCKHWDYDQVVKFWKDVFPLIRSAFENLTDETVFDWASAIAVGLANRDPNRYSPLLEFLANDPLGETTSFMACSRLYFAFCAINQQAWRNAELYGRCLKYFDSHLDHQFQNVRDKISTGLTNVYFNDVVFAYGASTRTAHIADFFKEISPRLTELYNSTLLKFANNHNNGSKLNVEKTCDELNGLCIQDNSEREKSIRLFKVVAKYVTTSVVRTVYSIVKEHYTLLPLACVLQSNEVDDELSTISTNLIAVFGSSTVPKKYLLDAFNSIESVACCPFWSARAVIAEFIPVFVFHNLATVIEGNLCEKIVDITLRLLEDIQPEVRVKASHAISGFLHVNFIKDPMSLLAMFRKKAKTKLKAGKNDNNSYAHLHVRHAGVLGLCSFINSRPYDVPDYLPTIFEDLGRHLNDPQPIPTSIRKTLGDFKRTHHANWDDHKLKFTENELSIFTDLVVPPSYYA